MIKKSIFLDNDKHRVSRKSNECYVTEIIQTKVSDQLTLVVAFLYNPNRPTFTHTISQPETR